MILLTKRWRARARFDYDSRRFQAVSLNTITFNTERNYDHE